jgi:hypothetical protein
MGNFASQGAVLSYIAKPPEEAGQADFGLSAIAIGAEVDLLMFYVAPRPPHLDLFIASPTV